MLYVVKCGEDTYVCTFDTPMKVLSSMSRKQNTGILSSVVTRKEIEWHGFIKPDLETYPEQKIYFKLV